MGRVLHASESGYFPFCITDGDPSQVGAGTEYPLGLSLTKAMELYWRIKEWNVFGSSSGQPFNFNFERNGELDPSPEPNSEEELVCARAIGGDFFPVPFDQISVLFYLLGGPEILKINDLYYPWISISGNYISAAWTSVADFGYPDVDIITLESFGQITCYKASNFAFSMTIKPIKWWPYGGLYDEDTGALV